MRGVASRFLIVAAFLSAGFLSAPVAQARVDIRINLASQSMTVTSPDGATHRWAISSGRSGYRTPTGVYSAKRLARMHYSSKYDDAPMPHSIFFSGGYAIHGTGSVGLLGRPASHGCVRLAPGNAARLFAMVRAHGARIAITGAAPDGGRTYAGERRAKRIAAEQDEDAPRRSIRRRAPSYYDGYDVYRGAPASVRGFRESPRVYWVLDGGGGAGWRLR